MSKQGYVSAKLANMRKPQEFLVTFTDKGNYMIQSDKSIGIFNAEGKGKLCTKGCYFPHLALATAYQFPPEFVQACKDNYYSPGRMDKAGLVTYVGTKEF